MTLTDRIISAWRTEQDPARAAMFRDWAVASHRIERALDEIVANAVEQEHIDDRERRGARFVAKVLRT